MAPKHSEDFKREAVRIAMHSGLTRRQVAADLGVGFSTLGKWMRDYSVDPTAAEDAELGHRLAAFTTPIAELSTALTSTRSACVVISCDLQ